MLKYLSLIIAMTVIASACANTAESIPTPSSTSAKSSPPASSAITSTLMVELKATVETGLPPTITPDAKGFAPSRVEEVEVQPLVVTPNSDYRSLWLAYRRGPADEEFKNFIAIYTRIDNTWHELSSVSFPYRDDISEVRQVEIESKRIWLEVLGHYGPHGWSYDLLSFDGKALRFEAGLVGSSGVPGEVVDFVADDGVAEVVLRASQDYVFDYGSGVSLEHYDILRWNGAEMVKVELTSLPASAQAELRGLNNRAIELAGANLWVDALTLINQAQEIDLENEIVLWNAYLIDLNVKGQAENATSDGYPLLEHLFYGNYAAVLDMMRAYEVAEIFNPQTPLIVGTKAENFQPAVIKRVTELTTTALEVKPDLAEAYFLRSWVKYLDDPNAPDILDDLEKAIELKPDEALFLQSKQYLQQSVISY